MHDSHPVTHLIAIQTFPTAYLLFFGMLGTVARRKLLAGKFGGDLVASEEWRPNCNSRNTRALGTNASLKRVYSLHVIPEAIPGPLLGSKSMRDLFFVRDDTINFSASYGTPVRQARMFLLLCADKCT